MTRHYTKHDFLPLCDPDRILREILIAMAHERGTRDHGYRSLRLEEEAEQRFAELNGWRTGFHFGFASRDLGKARSSVDVLYSSDWRDHPRYYKAPRRDGKRGWYNVAIVGQPYPNAFKIDKLEALIGEGFRLWLPPAPQASFHYPGCCFFLVLTAPDVERIEWLPEQTRPELAEMTEDGWENNEMLEKLRQLERMREWADA